MGLTLFLEQKETRQRHSFFSRQKFEFLVPNTSLSFVQTTPLLTLITRHQFLTKTTILHFTSLQGTYSLPRVTLLLYKYGFAEETNASLEDFGSFFFSRETWDRRFIFSRSSFLFCVRLSRKFIKFVKGVCS